MNKHKKSIQAIILTALVGLIVPQLFSLSNIEIFNKIAWKAILAGVFGLATFFVGFLYSIGIIKKRSVGGRTYHCYGRYHREVICVTARREGNR